MKDVDRVKGKVDTLPFYFNYYTYKLDARHSLLHSSNAHNRAKFSTTFVYLCNVNNLYLLALFDKNKI